MSGDLNIDQLAAVLACEIEAGIFEKHVSPALEVVRKVAQDKQQNTRQPVAWLKYPKKKPELRQVNFQKDLPVALKNSGWVSEPLYTAPPVPRDVLMAFGEDVREAIAGHALNTGKELNTRGFVREVRELDIAAIADRYASKVQPPRCAKCNTPDLCEEYGNACVDEPEPVNQQMLADALACCRNFKDAVAIFNDGPDDSDIAMAENKLKAALKFARSALAAEKEQGHD